ncbi:MAG TPA: hypothetical protein VF507_04180, partial [Pyrinomonadaceae bacterium]
MLIKRADDIKSSEITDRKVYLARRLFLRGAVMAATAVGSGALYRALNPPPAQVRPGIKIEDVVKPAPVEAAEN